MADLCLQCYIVLGSVKGSVKGRALRLERAFKRTPFHRLDTGGPPRRTPAAAHSVWMRSAYIAGRRPPLPSNLPLAGVSTKSGLHTVCVVHPNLAGRLASLKQCALLYPGIARVSRRSAPQPRSRSAPQAPPRSGRAGTCKSAKK